MRRTRRSAANAAADFEPIASVREMSALRLLQRAYEPLHGGARLVEVPVIAVVVAFD